MSQIWRWVPEGVSSGLSSWIPVRPVVPWCGSTSRRAGQFVDQDGCRRRYVERLDVPGACQGGDALAGVQGSGAKALFLVAKDDRHRAAIGRQPVQRLTPAQRRAKHPIAGLQLLENLGKSCCPVETYMLHAALGDAVAGFRRSGLRRMVGNHDAVQAEKCRGPHDGTE